MLKQVQHDDIAKNKAYLLAPFPIRAHLNPSNPFLKMVNKKATPKDGFFYIKTLLISVYITLTSGIVNL